MARKSTWLRARAWRRATLGIASPDSRVSQEAVQALPCCGRRSRTISCTSTSACEFWAWKKRDEADEAAHSPAVRILLTTRR